MSTDATTTETAFYDDTLIDAASHEHVVSARTAGREWAEREWSSATEAFDRDARDGSYSGPGEWYPTDGDARPLVSFEPSSDVEDQHEREMELATICNNAAGDRWAELVEDHENGDEHLSLLAISHAARDGFEHPVVRGLNAPVAWDQYSDADRAELAAARDSIAEDLANVETCRDLGASGIRQAEDERDAIDEAIAAIDGGARVRAAQDDDGWWFAFAKVAS